MSLIERATHQDERTIESDYYPILFEASSGNVEAAIVQRTERFFDYAKKTIGLSALAQEAAEQRGGWSIDIQVTPLGEFGNKPMRMTEELIYYDTLVVAAVIRDYRANGDIAVSFSRHGFSEEQRAAVFGEIDTLEDIIAK